MDIRHLDGDFPLRREASFSAQSWNPETRTIELSWTTGATVRRESWYDGVFDETLATAPENVRLGRLQNGAPFLRDHRLSVDSVLGVIERAWLDNGVGKAIVRLSNEPSDLPVVNKIVDGLIRKISVGYRVHKWQITEYDDRPDEYRAIDWEPHEVSAVAVGADDGANTRSLDIMSIANAPKGEETKVDAIAIAQNATARVLALQRAAKRLGIDADDTRLAAIIESPVTEIEARSQMIDLCAEHKASDIDATRIEAGGRDEKKTRMVAARDAIAHRVLGVAPTEQAREYVGYTFVELARDILARVYGERVKGMSRSRIVDLALQRREAPAYHGLDDFPLVLADVANNRLQRSYEESPRTFMAWATKALAADFRTQYASRMGGFPDLVEIAAETGEYTYGTVGEQQESYALGVFGRILAISRIAFINDDLKALERIPRTAGNAVGRLENSVMYALLTGNPTMGDGVALFDATHSNLVGSGSGAAPSATTLGAMRTAFRRQTGIENAHGEEPTLNLILRHVIMPASLETTWDQIASDHAYITTVGDTARLLTASQRKLLNPVFEPLLDATSTSQWYGAADPSQIETAEYAYLEGDEGPSIETRVGFEVDGMELKIRHQFGGGLMDYRGFQKNYGS